MALPVIWLSEGPIPVVASIISSIHPFPGAIPVGKTYPNMKLAPVLYNKVLLLPGVDDQQVGVLQLAVLVSLSPGEPIPRKPVAASPELHPVNRAAFRAIALEVRQLTGQGSQIHWEVLQVKEQCGMVCL